MLLMVATMILASAFKMKQQRKIHEHSDLRINYVTDAIKGIRTIKSCCFEQYFVDKIGEKRNAQVDYLQKSQWFDLIIFVALPVFTACFG